MTNDPLHQLRTICLALPEATEDYGGVGSPSYKVRDKIFAMHHPMNERPSLWMKAPQGFQDVITNAEPERFFVPPYVGHHGWIGLWLDVEQDWGFVASLVEDSYRITAPKRLIKQLTARKPEK
jgi:predicted DNA-binding protein (MmcQ/YjbR family)